MKAKRGEAKAFFQQALNSDTDECIIWPFGKDGTGYGKLKYGGKISPVNRLVCQAVYGDPEDDSLQAAHNCGERACINYKHLRWATQGENELDKYLHDRMMHSEGHARAVLTNDQIKEIRRLYKEKQFSQKEIGRMFGIDQSHVSQITRRKLYKNV